MKKTNRMARCPKCGRLVAVHVTRFGDEVLAVHSIGAHIDGSDHSYDTDALGYRSHNELAEVDSRIRCSGSGEPAS